MPSHSGAPTRRQDSISFNKRKKLIDEVLRKRNSINSAAKHIGIKYSTAKLIIKRFKETGTIHVRNTQRRHCAASSDLGSSSKTPDHRNSQLGEQEEIEEVSGPREAERPQNEVVWRGLSDQTAGQIFYPFQPWVLPQFMFYRLFWE